MTELDEIDVSAALDRLRSTLEQLDAQAAELSMAEAWCRSLIARLEKRAALPWSLDADEEPLLLAEVRRFSKAVVT